MTVNINTLSIEIHGIIVSNLLSSIEYRFDDGKEYITNTGNLRALLGYAKLGQDPHRAVLEALKFTAAPWRCSELAFDLVSCFPESLLEVDLSRTFPLVFPSPIPKLPNLQKAAILPTSDHLELIRHSPGLQHISVSFEFSSEWDAFIATVTSFQLKALDLSYKSTYGEKLHDRDWDVMKLRKPCQNLEHLTLRGMITVTGPVRLLVSTLQSLKRITLKVKLCDYNIDDLKDFPHLDITDVFSSSFSVIEGLKDRIKSLGRNFENCDKLLALSSFSQLKHLKVEGPKNFGHSLSAVITNLESLSVDFPYFLSLYRGRPYPAYNKLEVAPFISSLERAKNLSFLSIDKALVSGYDVGKILAVVGKNLKEFRICIDWQHEKAAYRIEAILKSIAKFCPNLQELKLLEDLSGTVPTIIASEEQKQNCLAVLSLISKTAKMFCSYSKIASIILNRFKGKRNEKELTWDRVFPPYGRE